MQKCCTEGIINRFCFSYQASSLSILNSSAPKIVWKPTPAGIYLLKVNIRKLEQGVKYVQS